jgi:hypothetical protein
MIHPDTALVPISPEIGLGVVATRRIPMGTIMWVRDDLDVVVPPHVVARLDPLRWPVFDKYAFSDPDGNRILCWDHARFVNHSCEPNLLGVGMDLEIAMRDIEAGEELLDDYRNLYLDEGFSCLCGTRPCTGAVHPSERDMLLPVWTEAFHRAVAHVPFVAQPLWHLVNERDMRALEAALRTVGVPLDAGAVAAR